MTRAILSAPLLAMALGACVPHDIHPVTQMMPDTALGLAGQAAPAIDAEWWRVYGDPQLNRIVADALAGNPSLDEALARLRSAQAGLARQQAGLRPTVSGTADVIASRFSENFLSFGGADKVRTVGIVGPSLSWNIDLFGKQRAAIREAGANARAAQLDIAAARLALAGSVAQTYIALTRAEAQLAVARETISTRQQSLGLVQAQVKNQLASQLQAEAAQTLLSQAKQSLEEAGRARVLATDALAALAGRGQDYAAAIGTSHLSLATSLALPSVLPADLLSRRPDIAAARARVDAAFAGRAMAKKAYYPNVNLMAFAQLQALGFGNLFSLDAASVGAGPAITLPIFEGGKLRAGLEGATAEVDLATAQYNEKVVGAVREAADAAEQVRGLQRELANSHDVVRGFAETQRLNNIRIQSGLESRLDTVETDIRLLDARLTDTTLAAAAADQRVALIVALGGGYTPRQDSPK